MFTALILACNVNLTECRTLMHPYAFQDKDMCMDSLGEGIVVAERQGLYVKDYLCHKWDEQT